MQSLVHKHEILSKRKDNIKFLRLMDMLYHIKNLTEEGILVTKHRETTQNRIGKQNSKLCCNMKQKEQNIKNREKITYYIYRT